MNNQELLICECSSREHQIIMEHEPEDNVVYTTIHLTKLSFWKRLKYLFGYQCKYGAFEEIILSKEHIPALNRIIFKLRNNEKS